MGIDVSLRSLKWKIDCKWGLTKNEIFEVLKIISSSEISPIIILTSDHGWGFFHHFEQPLEENRTFLLQRHNNLQAFYPSTNTESYDDLTSVNVFRQIFNDNFGTNLQLLDNNAFFVKKDTVTSNYISQTDVTEIVKPKN